MRIIWQDEAERDLNSIVEYIVEDDPDAALRVLSTIREAAWVLIEHPHIGRAGQVEETRELVIAGLPCRSATTSWIWRNGQELATLRP